MYAAFIEQPVTEESMTWSGWDAALIKSKQQQAKQKLPPNDHDQKSLEEDTVKSAKEVKVDRVGTAEALRCGLWHMAVGDQRCEPLLPTILKVVADATQKAKRHIKWVTLHKLLPPHLFNKLQVDLSNSITKFILSVFEMEDFATGCKSKMRDDSIQNLFMEFQTKFVPAGKRDFMNMDKCRQNQKISMEVLADWEDKSVQYECLEGLYEQDIAFLLQYRVVTQLADVTLALRCGLWHMAVGDQRCEPLLPTILKVVADATQKAKRHIKWVTLHKLLPPHLFNKLQVDLSNSITKFILSVFEMEDFATGCKSKMRDDSIQNLFMEFQTKFVPAGKRDFMNMDKCRQNQKISMEVLADWEDKSVQYKCLERLYEQDIAFLLQYRVVTQLADVTLITAKTVSIFKPPDNEIDTEHVVKAMKSFVPLKGESKMQLTLELSRKKCYHVLEHLFVEVCEGFLSDELFKALEGSIGDLPVLHRPITALSVLSNLVSQVQQGIYTLADGKSMLLNYSQACATLPLREGPFGVFSDEVVEVVRNADLERRLQGHHFIGVQDILFSLLHSRVGDHELVRSGLSKSSPPETPEIPPYKIYKLAGDYAAKRCGGELNPVTLEHLVWAVNNVIEGKDCIPVDVGGAFPRVEAWKDRGLEYDSKPITDCEGLVYAILHGLNLPNDKFRVERLISETNN